MSERLEGKVAIVTGAGRGLGRCHALALAAAGAAVVVNDLASDAGGEDGDPAEAVAAAIRQAGGRAAANHDSVADWGSARALVQAAVDAFGRLDILVNNAGIIRYSALHEGAPEDWNDTIAVNLTGSAAASYWAAKHWAAAGPEAGRSIVNTTSPAGTHPGAGNAAYCVSKAGIIALTVTSAGELAPLGVRVNAVAPLARTRMADAIPGIGGLLAKPEQGFDRMAPDHASPLVVYLASPDCRFTGRVLGIEGDNLCLFGGFDVDLHLNNGERAWSAEGIGRALAKVDLQDHSHWMAPGGRLLPRRQPSDETLAVLARAEERPVG